MKFIKSIIYISICLLTISCDVELDSEVVIPKTNNITSELSVAGDHFGPGITVPVTVTLSQTFSKKVNVTVSATSKEATTTNATFTVNPGDTSVTGNLSLPATSNPLAGYAPKEAFVTVKVAGLAVMDEETDDKGVVSLVNDPNDTTTMTSNEVSLDYYTQLPPVSGAGSFVYLLDWDDPSEFDIDLQVIDAGFTSIFESSASGDRYESDFFNNSHPDGDYDFYFRIYTNDQSTTTSRDISYVLFTTQPDGTRNIYKGIIPAGTATGGARIDFATLTAAGDAYTFVID
ncbi:hypothetical protein [Polaribacter aquimarinus]|uniref:Uncharacterized protein n=1 Tax=Polaribacter aquimarinus TaxID=2100726 RepID=A0A2U2JDU7_9FLAO|nr:hypothetical protein [Polaribacter aquimarinus]PWG06533.1 hypothetical protein DIS07_01485 [Polaribacter aquimarinus]